MCRLPQALINFLKNEDGPTAVEYALMLALIIIVAIGVVTTLGSNSANTYTTVGSKAKPVGS
jgi:pilus assembly protein Flp/PilA